MISIAAAAYHLPDCEESLSTWCDRFAVPELLRQALAASGARTYRRAEGETVRGLASKALGKLLEQAPAPRAEVGAVLYFHTNASNALMPPDSMARSLMHEHGLAAGEVFSVSQQNCVSLFHCLRLLEAMFHADPALQHAIVLGADLILREDMRVIDASAVHSDAGAALWISRGAAARIGAIATYNDPRFFRGAYSSGQYEQNDRYFWSAVSVIRRAMQQAGVEVAHLRSLLPQNSNAPGWEKIASALRLPPDKLYGANIARLGHAFGADAVINLVDSGALTQPGAHLLFSSGLAGCFGAVLVQVDGAPVQAC